MKSEYLECGKIVGTHGVGGAMKLEPWSDSPQVIAALERLYVKEKSEYVVCKIDKASVAKNMIILRLEGIESIGDAEQLKGTVLYAAREDIAIDEGAHFIADLIGLPVIDEQSGHTYGQIADIINGGASDIYVINTDDGERMMPAVREFVKRIELDRGIYITPIEGMF